MSKNCIITTVKSKIKGNATSYIEKENEIFIPVSKKFTLNQTRAMAQDKVNKINKEYLSEKFGEVVSLNSSYTDGTGINIHPSQRLVDAYEVKEGNKTIQEVNTLSNRNIEYFNGEDALLVQDEDDRELKVQKELDKIVEKTNNIKFDENSQGLLFQKQTQYDKSLQQKVNDIKNILKNELPIEIADSITVLQDVPLDILGRNDLYLSMKDVLEEKGITNSFLINWLGVNLSSNLTRGNIIKSINSETQIEKMANDSYNKLLKLEDPILKNKDIKESFDKWIKALENYPVVFKDLMLKHAIKHLRNPERRSKFVLQLSIVALQQTYGIAVNKPHELNRIGKLYDSEVLKTVSDAVGHEPSASGKGYWVHIPKTSNKTRTKEDIQNLIDSVEEDLERYLIEEDFPYKQTLINDAKNQIKTLKNELDLFENNTNVQFKVNVELLKKLSPSTWCTSSGMASHYVENYDNYLLIVDGITVAGIEAGNVGSNGKIQVKEVTSRGNNGVSSIDHLDDTIAFFEKHNLDLNNETIKNAIVARDKGKTDNDIFKNIEDFEQTEEDYWAERNAIDIFNGEFEYDYDEFFQNQERPVENEDEIRVSSITTIEEAKDLFANRPELLHYFGLLSYWIKEDITIARLGIDYDSHNIANLDKNMPFYDELAILAVTKTPHVWNYLDTEKQNLTGLKEIYDNYLLQINRNVIDDLPFSKTNSNAVQGYYDAKTDTVVVIASNTPVNEASKVGIHEVAHRGMLRMAKELGGEKELFQVLKNAEKQLMEKLPELLKRTGHKSLESLMLDYGFNKNSEEGKFKLLQELSARWAETLIDKPKPTWWKKLLKSIGNWIKQFTGKTLNEKEVDELVGGFVKYGTKHSNNTNQDIKYQLSKEQSKGIIASEKTIRDLAARMSDRIGIPVRYISDRSQQFKGKLENGTAVINLAYATLDTPIHEILGHPIIRAIKNTAISKRKGFNLSNFEIKKDYKNNTWYIDFKPGYYREEFKSFVKTGFTDRKLAENSLKNNYSELYQNLLKELEYGKGKEVLDRVKRDYATKLIKGTAKDVENLKRWEERLTKDPNDEIAKTWRNEVAKKIEYGKYTLEEQQEEAIVELLGMMTAEKLDAVKDGKLISILKRLLKEIKAFMRDILFQKEVEIDKLPDNMTLGDLSDLLAYSNSKLILPGYEVEYTTPDNEKFKTYQEASNHISELAKSVEDVDLDNLNLNRDSFTNIPAFANNFERDGWQYRKKWDNTWERKQEGDLDYSPVTELAAKKAYHSIFTDKTIDNTINQFIEKNKEYEQSKEIIEEWKKVNNIQYNPEEVYSRGQEFSSVVGAYSSFDVNLMMQNLLSHIEDNEKAGGKFAISAYTKPIDKQIGHLEGGGGKIKFKLYPQSNDILWAANTDVFSGSVWDASKKVNKDKKSELLGVSYTKYPSLQNINSVQPNLASVVDDLAHHHNELGISLNFNNFELEVDEDVPYQTKKIINSINKILEQKRLEEVNNFINKLEKEC